MIKKLRVSVDGKSYDVTVEVADDSETTSTPPPPASTPRAPAPAPLPASSPAPAQPARSGSTPGDVPSPLAGRIIAINVTPGQDVKEGEHLLTVEAMKMNTSVTAPKSGKVAEILTAVGDAVAEGQVLVRITG